MRQTDISRALTVAIVGGGPRGLAAAEALSRHRDGRDVRVTIFEPFASPGAGPNYAPGQTSLNLLNIPLRSIDLPEVAHCPSFADWLKEEGIVLGADDYPPRALLGVYLDARFSALAASGLALDVVARGASDCCRESAGWMIDGDGPFDEVVLCPGHQPTADRQIDRWKAHAEKSGGLLADAYPGDVLLALADWQGRTVAIRGFGLAMIDVTRLLTEGLGGRFEMHGDGALTYRASGREPARLIPFSLNGMPPAPKPATGKVDAAYRVDDEESAAFRKAVARVVDADDGELAPVFEVLAGIAGRILGPGGERRVRAWLDAGAENDPGIPDDERPALAMARYLAMAEGREAPSVGYAAGQVWRHLQNDLRRAYNPRAKSATTADALVPFDDGMKRFSYGPPAQATRRLLALIDAGVLTLRQVDDPDIECVAQGWRVAEGKDVDTASVMVDSVLSGPVLEKVSSPLLASLRERGTLVPMGEKLGAVVSPDGQVLDDKGRPVTELSLLGRLATGSVIATDSLHDCFGAAVERWAQRLLNG